MQVSCIANPRSDVTMFVQINNCSFITVPVDSQNTSADLPNMTNDTATVNTVNTTSTPVWVVPMIVLPWLLLSMVTLSVLVYIVIIKGMLIKLQELMIIFLMHTISISS